MKSGILLGIVVVLVLLSQAGVGYLAFKSASREEAQAAIQQHDQGRVEKLTALAAVTEKELERLQPLKDSLEAELTSLKMQVEQVNGELQEKLGKVRDLQVEEMRLAGTIDESQKSTRELASLEAATAAAQDSLEAKQKEAAILEAKVLRLLDDVEQLARDSAFVETAESVGKSMNERLLKLQATLSEQEEAARASAAKAAESRVILEAASGDLETLEKQKSAVEEEILERRRELATLDGEIASKKAKSQDASETNDNDPSAPK
jgi:chromosome segregation ATPase